MSSSLRTKAWFSSVVRPLLAVTAFACLLLAAGVARAQTPGQYRVAVLLTDADDSSQTYEALVDALAQDDDVAVVESGRVLAASDARGVNREDYRKGSRRGRLTDTFASIMSETGVDAMVLVDMISRGRRVQAVVIGPDGGEVADIRTGVRDALASDQALRAELVEPILSEIRSSVELDVDLMPDKPAADARDRDSEPAESSRRAEGSGPAQSGETSREVHTGSQTSRPTTRPSKRAFTLTGGGFFGRRSFTASTSGDYGIRHATPQLGAHAAAKLRLAEFTDSHGELLLELQGAWAPYLVAFDVLGQQYREAGQHMSGRLEVVYQQELTSGLSVRTGLGGDVVSDTIESNPVFTGSRYANGRLVIGFTFHPIDNIELGVSGGVMPTLLAETSGASYGEGSLGLGYTGGAAMSVALSEHLVLHAGYDLRAYRVDFANPSIIDVSIRTLELFHGTTFGLAYAL